MVPICGRPLACVPAAVCPPLRLLSLFCQGMESYCVRAFAEALEVVPYTLAENAGLNPIQIVTELRNLHAQDNGAGAYYGINVKKVGVWPAAAAVGWVVIGSVHLRSWWGACVSGQMCGQ